jgi:anti-sigma factor RsiW
MNCDEVQSRLHESRKGRLDEGPRGEISAHLETCAACTQVDRMEEALDEVLKRLPRHAAPARLKRRLGNLVARPAAADASMTGALTRWGRYLAPAMAAGLAIVVGGALVQRSARQDGALASLTGEAVNDHLRVLASQHPVEIESGGKHQVKPWFEGKLDFAPEVPSLEDTELRLRGGSVGYFFDRKAAVLVYAIRQHQVTLLVLRPEGLAWPDTGAGPARGRVTAARGFNVVFWRAGELGYALVSDVSPEELGQLSVRLAAATRERSP